ncbi:hypothetical protein [Ralstonia soli]|uniref:Uncharacterized protein n=1 Tax=Ralstonia soli TaxID=2953896 RepID=A0ABT1AMI3_9RALS|nr:hypothetical protein [Ralstonia soli]MCO5399644.1 hypothetical protein [Ralstonia soli]
MKRGTLSFSKALPITKEVAQKNNNHHSDRGITPQHRQHGAQPLTVAIRTGGHHAATSIG